jgi:hypothetical protein
MPVLLSRRRWGGTILLLLCLASWVQGQEPTLRLPSLSMSGLRQSVTESSTLVEFVVENYTDQDRLARVVVYYQSDADTHYAKEIWVPAQSRIASTMLLGPAPAEATKQAREIYYQLIDRTDGANTIIRPSGEEVRRSRVLLYQKREPTTVLFVDEYVEPAQTLGMLPQDDPPEEQAGQFVLLMRTAQSLSPLVARIYGKRLPATPEAYQGIDHFILASNTLKNDPVGIRALRQWIRQGGILWVMLDRVDPHLVASLFDGTLDFQMVGRLPLSKFTMQNHLPGTGVQIDPPQERDPPVDFARVQLPTGESSVLTIDGWPVFFTRPLGQGNIVFTTLGPRGWYRPRALNETVQPPMVAPKKGPGPIPTPTPQYDSITNKLPIPANALVPVCKFLRVSTGDKPFADATFTPMLGSEIGYAVMPLRTVVLLFVLFLGLELFLGLFLRRVRKPMLVGGTSALLALGAAGMFLLVGDLSRKTGATLGVGQIVSAIGSTEEVSVRGLQASYQPISGPIVASAEQGGYFNLDRKGLEGNNAVRLMTDHDAWRWENLATPAGVRLAPFRFPLATPRPIRATVRFTPTGMDGTVNAEPFQNLGDAVFCGPGERRTAARVGQEKLEVKATEMLGANDFLASTTLTDRQQRRLQLAREFVKADEFRLLKNDTVLLAWADPVSTPFNRSSTAKRTGEAMLLIPVEYQRPKPGDRITVPASCIGFTRLVEEKLPIALVRESDRPLDGHFRFQLPRELLPLKLEQARFTIRLEAASRRVILSEGANKRGAELYRSESPLDVIRVEIDRTSALKLDSEGGLHLHLSISDLLETNPDPERLKPSWKIDFLELEVTGVAE